MHRRAFITRTGLGLIGVSLAGCGSHRVLPLIDGIRVPFVTPTGTHYVKNGAEGSIRGWREPAIDPDAWSLRVDGLVATPLTVTLADLEAEAAAGIEIVKTMQCVVDSGAVPGLVGTARWWGVPLSIFLDRAGLDHARTRRLHLFGADGFTNNLPIDRLAPADTAEPVVEPLLVTRMNGEPLPRAHGAPVRLVIGDAFGYANIKWLTRVTATADDGVFGTYQDAGFTDEATAPVQSKLTAPTDNARLPAGPMTLHGFAVSGRAGIERVDVRIDGGGWQPARLASRREVLATEPLLQGVVQFADADRFGWPLRGVWIVWSFEWHAPPGRHLIEVRARDRAGGEQPELDLDIADGINTISITRVEIEG